MTSRQLRAAVRRQTTYLSRNSKQRPEADAPSLRDRLKQAGQVIVLFAIMLVVLIGLMGVAVDSSFAWRESLRVQRAADAAALAGVVYMPGDFTNAKLYARAEATKNGYTSGGGTVVSPLSVDNPRELDVQISSQVPTFFFRVFGVNQWTVTRLGKAVYVTPVPMGSPLAYYGAYQLCDVNDHCVSQSSPSGMSISSQGFFGAIEGEGSNRSTGDAFATYYNPYPAKNEGYSSDGYMYNVEAVSSGTLYLYDPMFCATATKPSGGHAGAGDHWLGTPTPVSTYFQLWDTKNTPLTEADDTVVWSSGSTYENQNYIDKSATYGSTDLTKYSDSGKPTGAADCQSNPAHNKWVTATNVSAGNTYRLQVTTTKPGDVSANLDETFENMFSLAVSGSGNRIYGNGAMITYANVTSGMQEFYLAQIDRTAGAGKTVIIDLFDPGDTGAPSWIQILPDGTPPWQPATFNYTSTNGRSGTSVTCIQTYAGTGGSPPAGCANLTSGGTLYNNAWIEIQIPLSSTYGDAAHPLSNSGWWKIRYYVSKGNDTTTWQVSVNGNPVHLIN